MNSFPVTGALGFLVGYILPRDFERDPAHAICGIAGAIAFAVALHFVGKRRRRTS